MRLIVILRIMQIEEDNTFCCASVLTYVNGR